MTIRTVFFDVGETLIDETRIWAGWARFLGIPPGDFLAMLRSQIESDGEPIQLIERLLPGFDLVRAEAERAARGDPNGFEARDLYPDVRPAFAGLRARGLAPAIAGNQPVRARPVLESFGLEASPIVLSDEIGIHKPDPAFFAHIVNLASSPPDTIAYVGDRLDNDVIPARSAGLRTVFIARGPWGAVHRLRPDAVLAGARIDSLMELPELLGSW